MKKIIILFLVLCGAGLGTSCDDFLTEHPSTQFSPEDVYSSPNGVQAVLNSCYGYISQSNGYGGYLHMLLSWHTPTMQLQNRNSTYMVELATMNVAVDNSTADYVYDGAYQTINTVNDLLMNIGLCSGMSEAEHNRIEGEARLLRALSYFNLVRIFGALPYIDRPAASIEESHKPRTSIDRIYGLIIGDLEQAWNMLPEKGAHAHGRPHKWAAKAFLAKVYVALACIKEHPGEPFDAALFDKSAKEYWQLAYDNAKEVYDSHAYSLVPNFADLWVYTNKHTEESILEMEMNYVTGSVPLPSGLLGRRAPDQLVEQLRTDPPLARSVGRAQRPLSGRLARRVHLPRLQIQMQHDGRERKLQGQAVLHLSLYQGELSRPVYFEIRVPPLPAQMGRSDLHGGQRQRELHRLPLRRPAADAGRSG